MVERSSVILELVTGQVANQSKQYVRDLRGCGTVKKVTTCKRQFKSTNAKAVPKKQQILSQKPVKDTVTVKTTKSESILSYMSPMKRSEQKK